MTITVGIVLISAVVVAQAIAIRSSIKLGKAIKKQAELISKLK